MVLKNGYIYYKYQNRRMRIRFDVRILPKLRKKGLDIMELKTLNGMLLRPLYDFQLQAVSHFQNRGGFVLADEMGLGKTLSAIACITSAQSRKSLVVCPASVKYQWEKEITKSTKKQYQIFIAEGRNPTAIDRAMVRCSDIVIINYDILQGWAGVFIESYWDIMVLDEAHKIKNKESQRARAAERIKQRVEQTICLTGTPITDRNLDVWNVVNMADTNVFPSYWQFRKIFCTGLGARQSVNTKGLHETLVNSGVMLRRRKEDVFDELPEVTHTVIPLKLSSAELTEAENNVMNASREVDSARGSNIGQSMINLRGQIAKYRQETMKLKLKHIVDWIKDFLESSDQKLMVACIHREFGGKAIHKHFPDNSVLIDGDLSAKQKETAKNKFINDPDCRLVIGNILSVGTGTDGLQKVCSDLLYAELDWSPANMNQCTARLDRHGQKRPVSVSYVVVKDSIEEYLARTLDRKGDVVAGVLDDEKLAKEKTLMHLMNQYVGGIR